MKLREYFLIIKCDFFNHTSSQKSLNKNGNKMKLREYLMNNRLTQEQFAKMVGLTRATINRYLNQPVIPRPVHCMLISKATAGEVTEKDFSQEHIFKIKHLIERYGIELKDLASVLNMSEVDIHNKLNFRASVTEWENYLMMNHISKIIKNKKRNENKNGNKMRLREYLMNNRLTQEQFAKIVGLTRETINRYLNQPIMPKPEHCMLISKATGGEVTEKDFSQEHVLKIKNLMDKYGIKIKELSYVLGISEVATHHKLSFKTSVTEWEKHLMLNYVSKIIKNKKMGKKNASYKIQ